MNLSSSDYSWNFDWMEQQDVWKPSRCKIFILEDSVHDQTHCRPCEVIQPVAKVFPIFIIITISHQAKYVKYFQPNFYLQTIWTIYWDFVFLSVRVLDLEFVVIQRIDQNSVRGIIRGRHELKFGRFPVPNGGYIWYPKKFIKPILKILKFWWVPATVHEDPWSLL